MKKQPITLDTVMTDTGLYRQRHISKPWGYEEVLAITPFYMAKLLFIQHGHMLSMQYHEEKTETLYVLYGKCRAFYGPSAEELERRVLNVHSVLHLPSGTVHRLEAIQNTLLVETSTPHPLDVVRLEDKYGRKTQKKSARKR